MSSSLAQRLDRARQQAAPNGHRQNGCGPWAVVGMMVRLPPGATSGSGILRRAIERRIRLTARRCPCRSCVSSLAAFRVLTFPIHSIVHSIPRCPFFVPVVTACAVPAISDDRWESAIRILAASKQHLAVQCSSANRIPAARRSAARPLLIPRSPYQPAQDCADKRSTSSCASCAIPAKNSVTATESRIDWLEGGISARIAHLVRPCSCPPRSPHTRQTSPQSARCPSILRCPARPRHCLVRVWTLVARERDLMQ